MRQRSAVPFAIVFLLGWGLSAVAQDTVSDAVEKALWCGGAYLDLQTLNAARLANRLAASMAASAVPSEALIGQIVSRCHATISKSGGTTQRQIVGGYGSPAVLVGLIAAACRRCSVIGEVSVHDGAGHHFAMRPAGPGCSEATVIC